MHRCDLHRVAMFHRVFPLKFITLTDKWNKSTKAIEQLLLIFFSPPNFLHMLLELKIIVILPIRKKGGKKNERKAKWNQNIANKPRKSLKVSVKKIWEDISWGEPSETPPAGCHNAVTAADYCCKCQSSFPFPGYFQKLNQGLIFSHEGNPNELPLTRVMNSHPRNLMHFHLRELLVTD